MTRNSALSEQQPRFTPHIPRTPGAVDRPRLLDYLRAGDYRLTLISAPPGYGKTTLASQFAQRASLPVVWHAVEERERDVPNLQAHALAVLEDVAPGVRGAAYPDSAPPDELAGLIAEYLRREARDPFFYVLDDVHRLSGSLATESWLRALVALAPPNCHLILLTRSLPDLPFAEMIARGEVLALGQDQLRLTVEEAHALARHMSDQERAEGEIESIVARLEGWPAGTVLALQPLPTPLEQGMLSGGEGPNALFDLLAESMLLGQPPELSSFLLASSTLPRLTPELCASVLGISESAGQLAEVQQRNLFISRAAGGLVYHTLFRNFLQRKLRQSDAGLFASLHARAARWYESRAEHEEAFDHYVAAQLPGAAAAVAEHAAPTYSVQGKVETLLAWREQLQEAGVAAPQLAARCAKIHIHRYEYEAAEAALDEAEHLLREESDSAGVADVMVQRAMIHLQRGDYPEAAAQATLIAEVAPPVNNLRGRAQRILGFSQVRMGDAEAGIRLLEETVPLYRADGDQNALSHLLLDLQVSYTQIGALDRAGACLQEIVALRRTLGSASTLAIALNNLGYHCHQHSDYAQARKTFQEGLSVIARLTDHRNESYLLWSLGDLERDLSHYEEAHKAYTRALQIEAGREPYLRCVVLISYSTLRRWQGRYQEAILLAEEAVRTARQHKIGVETATAQAALAAARACIGDVDDSARRLQDAVIALRARQARFELTGVLAVAAYVSALAGDREAAREYLEEAAWLSEQISTAQRLAAEMNHIPDLSALVSEAGIRSQVVTRDLRALRSAAERLVRTSEARAAQAENLTYSLHVLTLGHENIERDGRPIAPGEWRAIGARELFLYLLFNGPDTKESICLEFWPDKSPEKVRSTFHTTLWRARHALGENVIQLDGNLYHVNAGLDIWCDAQEMEVLAKTARPLPVRDPRTEDLWRRAVELYGGDLLPSLDSDWAFMRREALREMYLEGLVRLGECIQAREDFRQALESFKQALNVDPYREDVHRAIMRCYHGMGEKPLIATHYEELRTLLRRDLNIEPSEETVALAQLLLG